MYQANNNLEPSSALPAPTAAHLVPGLIRYPAVAILLFVTACTFEGPQLDPFDLDPDGMPSQFNTSLFRQGVEYSGTQDTFIDATAQGTSQGRQDRLSLAFSVMANEVALIRFDDIFGTGLRQIPPGAMILSAELTLSRLDSGSTGSVDVYESAAAWNEDTTWDAFGPQPGIQLQDKRDGVASMQMRVGTAPVINVKDSIERWAVDPQSNLGWIIEPSSDGAMAVASSEYLDNALRPKLIVKWIE